MQKFRIGVVGAGIIGHDHVNTLHRLGTTKQVSIFDQDTARAGQIADKFGATVADSLPALVEGSDIVWICTPPFARREAILAACKAQKPIFCEKPAALTAKDCTWVQAAVKKAGVPFFMGQSGRYSYFFQKMQELVAGGSIGQPTSIWSIRQGRLDPAKTPKWRLDDDLSGGILVELGVHEIDFMRWIGGDWQSVYARGSAACLLPGKFQDAVAAVGTLRSGVTTRLDISYSNPRYLWQRGVDGTEGSLFFDDSDVRHVHLHRPGQKVKSYKTGDWQNPVTKENLSLREQNKAVLAALAAGAAPPVTLDDGIAAVRVALAMRESTHTGRVIAVGTR